MITSEQAVSTPPFGPHRLPLCRGCHKPMRLEKVEPHPRYNNLDQCEFKCECGSVMDALMARSPPGVH